MRPSTESAEKNLPGEVAAARDIVLITLDTLRADALGFETGPWSTPTPRLERLAEEGRRFSFAHAHNTVTLPSHANILTGLYPYEHGVRENTGFVLPESVPSAASLFKEAGFATGAFVSAYTLDSRYGLGRGFDVYDDQLEGEESGLFQVAERPGDAVVERALDWWRRVGDERRRFLWLHLFDPHAPYEPPTPFAERYRDRPYRGEVAAVDAFLTELFDELDAEAPPLIVVTADHGESLGEHGELTHGVFAYQGTLRVPLLIWGPGIGAGVDDRLARHIDILPTLLAAANLRPPGGPSLSGHSLLAPPRASVASYFECLGPALERGWAPLRGLIQGRHKLIDLPLPELYDLEADPLESENLVASERRLFHRLRGLLAEESVWPPEQGQVDAEEAARLRSLGYLADSAERRESYGVEDDPKNLIELDGLIHRFSAAFHGGRLGEAEALARELIARRPSMPVGHTQLAQALLARQEKTAAIEVMARAHGRGAASPGLVRQMALSLAELGRAEEALPLLGEMVGSGDLDAESVYGQVLQALGRAGEAESILKAVLEREPGHAASWERLSAVDLDLSRPAEAEKHARRAVELDGGRAGAFNNLGVALFIQGKPDEAFAAWSRALDLDPQAFDTLYNLGMQSARLGRMDLALPALRRFLAEAPERSHAQERHKARAVLDQLAR